MFGFSHPWIYEYTKQKRELGTYHTSKYSYFDMGKPSTKGGTFEPDSHRFAIKLAHQSFINPP